MENPVAAHSGLVCCGSRGLSGEVSRLVRENWLPEQRPPSARYGCPPQQQSRIAKLRKIHWIRRQFIMDSQRCLERDADFCKRLTAEVVNQLAHKRNHNNELEKQLSDLRAQVSDSKRRHDEALDLKEKKNEELNSALQSQAQELSNAKRRAQRLDTDSAEARRRHQQALDVKEKRIKEHEDAAKSQAQELSSTNRRIQKLNAELVNARRQHEEEIWKRAASVENMAGSHREELQSQKDDIRALQDHLTAADAELEGKIGSSSVSRLRLEPLDRAGGMPASQQARPTD
jgi:chromosome segregation ATPase